MKSASALHLEVAILTVGPPQNPIRVDYRGFALYTTSGAIMNRL
jgi:hypothetical protein